MHWRKVRIVRGWLCWRKWSRSDDADSHFRSFPPCLVSLGLIRTCCEVSSPQINIVQGSLELNGPHTTPIYAPWYFCPHKQGFWPHSPPCKSAQIVLWLSSEVSIPWYPTWLSFRQDIALWSNMGQLIPHSLWFFINVFFLLGHPGLPVLVSSANHGKPPCTKCLVITGDGFLPCPGKMHFQVLPTLKLVLSYWQWRSASK